MTGVIDNLDHKYRDEILSLARTMKPYQLYKIRDEALKIGVERAKANEMVVDLMATLDELMNAEE